MEGHSLKIFHGYGGTPEIKLDEFDLKRVKSFTLKGEAGKLAELTVTLDVKSSVYKEKRALNNT